MKKIDDLEGLKVGVEKDIKDLELPKMVIHVEGLCSLLNSLGFRL